MDTSIVPQKRCSKCKQMFPATPEYFRHYRKALHPSCRKCECAYFAERRKNHPEAIKCAQQKFKENNPIRAKEIKNKWTRANLDKVALSAQKRYQNKRDEIRQRQNAYERNHLEAKRARTEKRRLKIKAIGGVITAADLRTLYIEQEGRCAYCGISIYWDIKNDIHLDHVMPLNRGGQHNTGNCLLTCSNCNLTKGQKTVVEWSRVRGW